MKLNMEKYKKITPRGNQELFFYKILWKKMQKSVEYLFKNAIIYIRNTNKLRIYKTFNK